MTETDKSIDLKGLGLKATGPRLRILEIFRKTLEKGQQRHLSAEEVYRQLVNEGDDIGLATVYRVLAQFASAGILVRRTFETGTAVYELDDGHHHDHMICVKCGKVEEFIDPEIEKLQSAIANKFNYELCDHSMALYGICLDCQKKK
ncbi:MAG: ferric iron uptake transcriptional regulator [Burkholderiaceae bacterium]|nr:ferric iron uptake transcriptional regulator [Burkholderiaceae bacterium]